MSIKKIKNQKSNVPTRTSILNIAIFVDSFCPHNVRFPRP